MLVSTWTNTNRTAFYTYLRTHARAQIRTHAHTHTRACTTDMGDASRDERTIGGGRVRGVRREGAEKEGERELNADAAGAAVGGGSHVLFDPHLQTHIQTHMQAHAAAQAHSQIQIQIKVPDDAILDIDLGGGGGGGWGQILDLGKVCCVYGCNDLSVSMSESHARRL